MTWMDILASSNAVISDNVIRKMNEEGLLIEELLKDVQIQPNSVDLTLANKWKAILPNAGYDEYKYIDPRKPMNYQEDSFLYDNDHGEHFFVAPKEFILMASNETLNIPNGFVALVCGRSSIARLGIQTEQAGFIDAGFRGTITLEVYNQNDCHVVLYAGMRIAQVYFLKADHPKVGYCEKRGSKYNDQIDPTEGKLYLDPEFNNRIHEVVH